MESRRRSPERTTDDPLSSALTFLSFFYGDLDLSLDRRRSSNTVVRVFARLKRKGAATERAGKKTARKEKAAEDPNKPKRPPSAFFAFMNGFAATFFTQHELLRRAFSTLNQSCTSSSTSSVTVLFFD